MLHLLPLLRSKVDVASLKVATLLEKRTERSCGFKAVGQRLAPFIFLWRHTSSPTSKSASLLFYVVVRRIGRTTAVSPSRTNSSLGTILTTTKLFGTWGTFVLSTLGASNNLLGGLMVRCPRGERRRAQSQKRRMRPRWRHPGMHAGFGGDSGK